MARKKGQTYTAEQKANVVLELIKEEKTLNELATQYKVTPKTIQNWKKQFLTNASKVFEDDGSSSKEELKKLQSENDELAKTLGRTTVERDWAVKKLKSLDLSDKKDLVESKLTTNISMTRQAKLIELNRSALYYKPVGFNNMDLQILNQIDEIYTENPEYGYRMIHQQLKEDGYRIGNNRVLKYMGMLGIQALYPHKKKLTSIKNAEHPIYPYLLKEYWYKTGKKSKAVKVDRPNEVWSGDITYIRMNGGAMAKSLTLSQIFLTHLLYLAAVIDWHSRAILAYKLSNSMDATLATDVLKMALDKYPAPKIFNSDQGSQYTSYEHTQMLKDNNIQISMNGKGRTIDNIIIERFFRTLKQNNIYISDYQSIKELKQGVSEYIHKYNFKRFHSSLKYQKPMNVYLDFIQKTA
jgi:putative transposase